MTEEQILLKKLNAALQNRSHDIGEAIQQMEQTGQMLDDYLVPSNTMNFHVNDAGLVVMDSPYIDSPSQTLHVNAVRQFADRMGVNTRDAVNEATGPKWKRDAYVHRMNAYAENVGKGNLLVRSVNDEARGILSDRYRRLNTSGIFMAFLMAAQQAGSVLVDAASTDTKNYMEVIHPELVHIPTVKNGDIVTVFGAQIRNSDFGASKLELRIFMMQVTCLNGMTSKSMISDVHLGSKLVAEGVTFSDDTYVKDTEARAAMVRDIMGSLYSPDNINRERERIEHASDIELDFVAELGKLPKAGWRPGEIKSLEKALMENDPEAGIAGKNTLWKMAQGMSHIANGVENKERKRELVDLASNMMASYVD